MDKNLKHTCVYPRCGPNKVVTHRYLEREDEQRDVSVQLAGGFPDL